MTTTVTATLQAVEAAWQQLRLAGHPVAGVPATYDLRGAINSAFACGYSLLPPMEDGTKRPALRAWTPYQQRQPSLAEVRRMWADDPTGLGLVTGYNGLEMLEWEGRAVAAGLLGEYTERAIVAGLGDVLACVMDGYMEATPGGGVHLLYVVPTPRGNTKLAQRADRLGLLETRGDGGYSVVAPSSGTVHDTGRPWVLLAGGFGTIARITDDERDDLWDIARSLTELLPPPPPPEPSPNGQAAGDAPGHRYNALPNVQELTLDVLARHGYPLVGSRQYGGRALAYVRRPGKPAGWSATVGWAGPGVVHMFSTSSPHFDAETSYSPFRVYALLEHGGNWSAAAAELLRSGVVASPRPVVLRTSRPASTDDGQPCATPDADAGAGPCATRLPDTFWQARPSLLHIRQAARSRLIGADGVLGAVLARLAARTPHRLGLPGIAADEAGLSLLVAIVGPPGTGKSSAMRVAAKLLPAPDDEDLVIIPSGSGEGLADAFYVTVTEDTGTGKGKGTPTRKVGHHNLFVVIDEGSKALKQAGRAGMTVFETWRTLYTEGLLGEANASADRKRQVSSGQYRAGLVLGIQPKAIGPLLDDEPQATPQRFLYLTSTDPGLSADAPDWPGPLDWGPGLVVGQQLALGATYAEHVVVHPSVADEIRAAHLARQQGVTGDADEDWAAHRNLLRLKIAALLAILELRASVTPDDWALAGVLVDVSDAVRKAAAASVAAVAARTERTTSARLARRGVESAVAMESHHVTETARLIAAVVRKSPGELSPSDARKRISAARRQWWEEAFAYAQDVGWIEVRREAGQGEDRVRLYPGKERP